MGVAQKKDDEQGIDEQDVLERVVFFLPAIAVRLCRRVLGADDAPFSLPSWAKGGRWPGDWRRGWRGFCQRYAYSCRLRNTQPLRESREGSGRGIAEGAQRGRQRGQEHVNPLIGFALDHPNKRPCTTWRA